MTKAEKIGEWLGRFVFGTIIAFFLFMFTLLFVGSYPSIKHDVLRILGMLD